MWDAVTGGELSTFPHKHIVKSVEFSPTAANNSSQAAWLATGGHEGKLRVFDLATSALAFEVRRATANRPLMLLPRAFGLTTFASLALKRQADAFPTEFGKVQIQKVSRPRSSCAPTYTGKRLSGWVVPINPRSIESVTLIRDLASPRASGSRGATRARPSSTWSDVMVRTGRVVARDLDALHCFRRRDHPALGRARAERRRRGERGARDRHLGRGRVWEGHPGH